VNKVWASITTRSFIKIDHRAAVNLSTKRHEAPVAGYRQRHRNLNAPVRPSEDKEIATRWHRAFRPLDNLCLEDGKKWRIKRAEVDDSSIDECE